jgi:uncharacterized phage-associated protein
MPPTTAKQVAEFIIWFSQVHGDPISNLKLQKLLYYAQAWYLALYDEPLFSERIEAWVRGPVVPPVYGDYKSNTWNPIQEIPEKPTLPPKVEAHLKEVMEAYGGLTALHLEQLTHQEDPWNFARKGLPRDEPSNNIISLDDMKTYYRKMAESENKGE